MSTTARCGCRVFVQGKLVDCTGDGKWEHARYDGLFCDKCKEITEKVFPSGWYVRVEYQDKPKST